MASFQFEPYRSEATGTIADLLARMGYIRADAVRATGANNAHLASSLGQIAAGSLGDILEGRRALKQQQAMAARTQRLTNYFASGQPVTAEGLAAAGMPPEHIPETLKAFASLKPEPVKPVAVDTTDPQGNPVTQFVVPKAGDSFPKIRPKDEDTPVAKAMKIPGLLTPGTIDLYNRPPVKNPDGSTSTVRSMSFNEDGKEILIPTVVDGRVVSDQEAIDAYHQTGQHLGIFRDANLATAYAQQLHADYAAGKYTPKTEKLPNSQEADFLLDGKVVKGDYVPGANGQPGKYLYNGQDVTSRAQAKPTAATVNIGAGQNIPGDWDKEGPDFLASIPARWRKTVEKIARYDEDITKVTSMRNNERSMVAQWVNQVNPDWDQAQFASRAPMRKAFTSGSQAQAINSLNTAIGHLDQFVDVAKALGNGKFQPGNQLYNWYRTTFGDSAPTNFAGIKSIMAGELASAFKKSGATDQEIASVESAINSKNSTSQLVDYATQIAIPALGSKVASYNAQYRQVMGDRDPFKVLSPDAERVLTKYGLDAQHPTMGGATPPARIYYDSNGNPISK